MVIASYEYTFYLATTTLVSGTGGVLKPSVVTRSCTVGVAIGDLGRPKKGVCDAVANEVPAGGGNIFSLQEEVGKCSGTSYIVL